METKNIRVNNPTVETLFNLFQQYGHTLYLVGGCVRDFLMGVAYNDIDMCTDATPQEMMNIAHQHDIKVIPTGLPHGTLTFIKDHIHIEITTFRCERVYVDHRFPKEVTFTKHLQEDVQRRDFTINAIAMDGYEIYDFYQGQDDINNKIIRCVGDPLTRFEEDALRILRCLRFRCKLAFSIEENTWRALQSQASLLHTISKERVRDELCKMLECDFDDTLILLKESGVLDVILPEFISTYDFPQDTPWHIYDVFHHINAVVNASKGYPLTLKLALLFHDLEKVHTKTFDANGTAHFIGHAHASALLATQIMKRLKFDNKTIKDVYTMIEYHDYYMYDTRKSVHTLMYKLKGDFTMAYHILKIQLADNLGKNQALCIQKNRMIYGVMIMLKEMQANHECFTIQDLNISGHDVIALGFAPPEVGRVLAYALKYVLNQQHKNTKEELRKAVKGYRNETFNRK